MLSLHPIILCAPHWVLGVASLISGSTILMRHFSNSLARYSLQCMKRLDRSISLLPFPLYNFVSIVVRFGMRKVKRVMILRHAIRLTMGRVNVSAVQKAVCVQNVMMVSSYFLGVAILRIKRTS